MPGVETGYKPSPNELKSQSQWKDGDNNKKFINKMDQTDNTIQDIVEKDREDQAISKESERLDQLMDREDQIKIELTKLEINKNREGSEAGSERYTTLKRELESIQAKITNQQKELRSQEKKGSVKIEKVGSEEWKNWESEKKDPMLTKRKERLEKLIADYEVNGKAEFYGSKAMEETYKKLKAELEDVNTELSNKKEVSTTLKEKAQIIETVEKLLEKSNLTKEEQRTLQNIIAKEKNDFTKGIEIAHGEVSPETLKKEQIIEEVALMAVDPQDNKNMIDSNHIMNYTKYELANIINTEPDPEKRAQKLKEYLVGSLDQAIELRNEAKYGSGFMGKVKKFLNEGWGGALAKVGAGAGLIAGGLYSGIGIFSPVIYGAGLRMASEGVMHLGQEINDAFNKNSRKKLLEQGRLQLEQQVNAKIAELMKNPEMNSEDKITQAILQFVDKTYAREVQTLVEEDSSHLEKAEKARRYAGWVGGIGGMLVGMPMDIDADGVSHFVKFIGNDGSKWMQGSIARNLGEHLFTNGSLANIAGFGAGSMVTYMLNRGAEGDERAYKWKIRTTKSERDALEKTQTGSDAGKIEANEPMINGKTVSDTISTAENIVINKKNEEEKNKEKISILNQFITNIYNINNAKDLGELYDSTEGIENQIVGLKLMTEFPDNIKLQGDPNKRQEFFKNIQYNIIVNILESPEISDENKKIIRKILKKFEDQKKLEPQKLEPRRVSDVLKEMQENMKTAKVKNKNKEVVVEKTDPKYEENWEDSKEKILKQYAKMEKFITENNKEDENNLTKEEKEKIEKIIMDRVNYRKSYPNMPWLPNKEERKWINEIYNNLQERLKNK